MCFVCNNPFFFHHNIHIFAKIDLLNCLSLKIMAQRKVICFQFNFTSKSLNSVHILGSCTNYLLTTCLCIFFFTCFALIHTGQKKLKN